MASSESFIVVVSIEAIDDTDGGLFCSMLSCNLLSSASSLGLVGGTRCSSFLWVIKKGLKVLIGA